MSAVDVASKTWHIVTVTNMNGYPLLLTTDLSLELIVAIQHITNILKFLIMLNLLTCYICIQPCMLVYSITNHNSGLIIGPDWPWFLQELHEQPSGGYLQ